MKVMPTALEGVLIIEPRMFTDTRGFFCETYHRQRYARAGIHQEFVQDNLSFSVKNTLRGLHFQIRQPQAKLVQVLSGEVFDVAVDIRPGSPTFGQWVGERLSDRTGRQMFIPEGCAHGFCVLSSTARFAYKCTDFYQADDEGGILWSDPTIGIDWPVAAPLVSDKDRRHPCLGDLAPRDLPVIKSCRNVNK